MKPVINSRKHYVQFTEFVVASAGVATHTYVNAREIQNVSANSEVVEGNVVKAIFLEYWLSSNVTGNTSFVMIVEKAPSGTVAPTFSNLTTLDAYGNKKNILFTSQGLLPGNGDNPVPILRQWFKIPKGKQRMGFKDQLRVSIAALGTNAVLGCGFGTYKSIS